MSIDYTPIPTLPGGLYLSLYRGLIPPARPAGESIRSIAEEVAKRHGLTWQDLEGPSRVRRVFWARAEAMYRVRCVRWQDGTFRWGYPYIGRRFGGRHHTSVLNAVRVFCDHAGIEYPT